MECQSRIAKERRGGILTHLTTIFIFGKPSPYCPLSTHSRTHIKKTDSALFITVAGRARGSDYPDYFFKHETIFLHPPNQAFKTDWSISATHNSLRDFDLLRPGMDIFFTIAQGIIIRRSPLLEPQCHTFWRENRTATEPNIAFSLHCLTIAVALNQTAQSPFLSLSAVHAAELVGLGP